MSTIIKQVFMAINEYLVGRAAVDISMDLRQRIFEKALSLDRANLRGSVLLDSRLKLRKLPKV